MKSAKHHLNRVVGQPKLNYEELQTLLVQTEAILNSRPITPISNDLNHVTFPTPSHFIIGDSLTGILEPTLEHLRTNLKVGSMVMLKKTICLRCGGLLDASPNYMCQ